jgi:diguanylate cyclase (GGDEF)-like protein
MATHEFEIAPRLFERNGVRIGALLLALLAISMLPLAHIRALRRQRQRLLDEVADKTLALERLASTDALTGLANRRVFDAALDRALRGGGRPALLLLDIDYFKRYNDTLGHQAGDRCLIQVGELLGRCVRHEDDLAARLGGEEFALLAPRAEADTGAVLSARIRMLLQSLAMLHPDSPLSAQLTASIGYAWAEANESAESIYRRADRALYAAKAAGRDRAVDADSV